ncbi:DUF2793 domain-containing protein [Sphingomonas sp. SUN019]|uniref:DUF2793 domain-containing protein n=1 Tax=Sphingomonas sp. SUN019 TaxID=2937788 RepID=UPI0021648F33|nr:DUF2793 domain-containing protein [Sphingomonas sp. SUN019]UVO51438.1 DUF2793 domain-containing protein [Sphingomonas sp. SUN019]
MSDDRSARLDLPQLHAGQAQKETTHNEALALIDLAVQAAVVAVGVDTPPSGPAPGDCWIVGPGPVGAWAGRASAIAGWTAGGWRFVAAREGMRAWSVADGVDVRFAAGAWRAGDVPVARLLVDGVQVVGAQQPAVPPPTGGATVDAEARAAVALMLTALIEHGLLAS